MDDPIYDKYKKRILEKRKIDPNTNCWLFTGHKTKKGYGQIYFLGKLWLVHRLSLKLFKPEIFNDKLQGNHHCDTPACFNPEHLYMGTQSENRLDSISRGRWKNQNSGKTHCKEKHEFTTENTYTDKRGNRQCKKCKNSNMILRRLLGAKS